MIEVKKKAAPQVIQAWSFSRLNEYESCPKKSYFKVIEKLKEPGSEAMDRGAAIHKEGEDYLKGLLEEVPPSFAGLGQELAEAKMLGAKSEVEATFRKDWTSCGWFDEDAWLRVKIDMLLVQDGVVRIVDFKTGKNRGGYEDQLELYALTALLIYPDCKDVSCELWFTDSSEIIGTKAGTYNAGHLDDLKKKWEKRVTPMLCDTIFAPRPSSACKWCWFSQSKTGKCEY
jgi:RecB family exonuclease